nr:hypothetical protein [Gossypium schwendimanii]
MPGSAVLAAGSDFQLVWTGLPDVVILARDIPFQGYPGLGYPILELSRLGISYSR